MPVRSLAGLLAERGLRHVDYVSLDIEGGEMAVLSAFPFADLDVAVWTIENNARSPDVPGLMQSNGYSFVEVLGVDEIYAKTI